MLDVRRHRHDATITIIFDVATIMDVAIIMDVATTVLVFFILVSLCACFQPLVQNYDAIKASTPARLLLPMFVAVSLLGLGHFLYRYYCFRSGMILLKAG